MARRTEFLRAGQQHRRVQVYVELRDMWLGVFIAPTAVYVCVLGLVLRWRRSVRECAGDRSLERAARSVMVTHSLPQYSDLDRTRAFEQLATALRAVPRG